ncbi:MULTISPECIES: hypothetical protein [Raineya]|jgi:hypothetical protein|uniref:Uncharacterized protein n=1 Tax=Raineya orbicola TaxID=2016530 RepID=A0A2N3IG55_9BACT|nr:hypothetical protein [Raineya orbicola]PKQ69300.1 hypothetical protein Rain11_1453 [Raineya orbicola]
MLYKTQTHKESRVPLLARRTWGWRLLAYALLFSLASCKSCKKEKVEPTPDLECKECVEYSFYRKVRNLKGIVKKVGIADYYYNGGMYYVEINSSAIPELNQNYPTARLFPCCTNRYDDTDVGKEVTLNVDVFSCLTDKHGRLNNVFYNFYVFN